MVFGGVLVVLWWCCSGVVVVLWWCYGGVVVVFVGVVALFQ